MNRASLSGQNLGKYRVLEPLGSGGMARVYRGYHPQLDRYVAIKVLRSDLVEDETFLTRFRHEAQSVAALRHPNIIQVYDFDVEDGIYFMVMELLDGDTLHTRLNDYRVRNEQMSWGEMIRILLDVLDGLTYAHQEGMIHRDIKPANILLTQQGQAVVADFGIAQIVGGTRHTVSGALLGTLNYMAPEQGLEGVSDVRSDLYSLGIVLYEMLTRQPPFNADTPLAILLKHVNDPLPLPSELNPDIPLPLERIVLKALAKEPDGRFQTGTEMIEALKTAAAEANIEVPEFISPPLSFSTADAPADSVAVYSGEAREKLVDAQFAAQDTAVTHNESISEALAQLKAEEPPVNSITKAKPETATSTTLSTSVAPKPEQSGGRAVLSGLGILIFANALIIMFSGVVGADWFYSRGWPIELILGSVIFSQLMISQRSYWLSIPTGLILGQGILLGFYALTGRWSDWSYLWPLQVFVVLGVLWFTIRGGIEATDLERLAVLWGKRLRLLAFLVAGSYVAAILLF
ncbi:protein kinase domain-containing protein [Candidatus Leptofilum sp.]|uniref:protein kinase domain-containing protein n=1 Tax=Candidatus Leptofilum sp. TaxID=3241576 RepID=UPI003B5ADCFF